MTNKLAKTILLLVGMGIHCPLLSADEIILNEGRILKGRITEEDEEKVMIHVGPKMDLHVERSKIKAIYKEKREEEKPKYKIINVQKSTMTVSASTETAKSTTTASVAVSTAAAPAAVVAPPEPVPQFSGEVKEFKKGSIQLVEYVQVISVSTRPSDVFIEKGNIILFKKNNKEVGAVSLQSKWNGTVKMDNGRALWGTGVVVATVTVQQPTLVNGKSDVPLLKKIHDHASGHLEIAHATLVSIVEALSVLRAANEKELREKSDLLIKDYLQRSQKQHQGFDRRESSPKKVKP